MSSIKSQSSFGDSNSSLTDPESRSSKVFISKRMPHLGSNFSFESSQSVLYNISEPGIVAAVPSYEYYGYVVYLVSFGFFGLYCAWAYLPDKVLNSLGISYYPDRYWALAVPAWIFMLVIFVYYFYICYILYCVEPLGTKANFTDNYSQLDIKKSLGDFDVKQLGGIPEITDLPIEVVNYCLYS
ncbi:hypothetical protein BB558_007497 [Smittium angustum]|uniref:PIG-P domain-containing protein n=1 Tax=Smittium angustum TaxID=133377 RepID=A0A2U1IUU3_SMIAN|nr:hypothetical protein BB558_007497 [Smittium angustum]